MPVTHRTRNTETPRAWEVRQKVRKQARAAARAVTSPPDLRVVVTPPAPGRQSTTKPAKPAVVLKPGDKGTPGYVNPDVRPYMEAAIHFYDQDPRSAKEKSDKGAGSHETIRNWKRFQTKNPRMDTILMTLRASGKDLEVVDLDSRKVASRQDSWMEPREERRRRKKDSQARH